MTITEKVSASPIFVSASRAVQGSVPATINFYTPRRCPDGHFGAKVIAVHVVHRFLHGPTLIAASPSERNRAEEQLRRRTEEWLRQQV